MKKYLSLFFTFIIIILSLWLAFKDINYNKFFIIIFSMDYEFLFLIIPVIVISHLIRAIRWRYILNSSYGNLKFSLLELFSSVMIGYSINAVISRAGEFVRPYIISKKYNISYSTTFATIIVERFIDLLFLILLFIVTLFLIGKLLLNLLPQTETKAIIILVLFIVFFILINLNPKIFNFVNDNLIKKFSIKISVKLSLLYNKFLNGFSVLKNRTKYFRIFLDSIWIWFFYTIPLYVLFFMFDFNVEYNLSFEAALVLIVVSGIGVTIAPSPGAIGVYHLLISNVLIMMYNVPKEEAIAYATVSHFISYVLQLLIGGSFLLFEYVKNPEFFLNYTKFKENK